MVLVPYGLQAANRKKMMSYNYDLVSGNVKEFVYQPEEDDQFIHQYEYDEDFRLKHVYTSRQGVYWDEEAVYFYYDHGLLARAEIGDQKVQGMDYAYTIHGYIKGMNSTADQHLHID